MPQDPSLQGEDLARLVEDTGRTLGRNTLVAGSAWVQAAALGWLLLAVAVDLLAPMSVPMRLAAHVVFWLVLLGALGLWVVFPLRRSPTLPEVALRMEKSVGGMHNRLVTLLDILKRNGSAGVSGAMVERLVEQTRARLAGYTTRRVADPGPMRRGLMAVGVTVLLFAAMALLFSNRLPTALARVVMPTADIPPDSWLRIEIPGDRRVLSGEPYTLRARAVRGEADRMTLQLRPLGDDRTPWVKYPMRREADGSFSFEVPAVTEHFAYKVAAGRTWTRVHKLTAVPRPVVEGLSAAVVLPEYMGLPEPRVVPPEEKRIVAPIGGVLRLTAAVGGEAERGEVVLLRARTVETQKTVDDETAWFEDEPPPDAVLQGRWLWTTEDVHSGVRSHTFNWDRATYGLRTRLHPLHVPPEGLFFVYAAIDAQEPPTQVVVTLGSGDQARSLVWGAPADQLEKEKPGTTRHLGPLPRPGQWARLEVPVKDLFPTPAEGVKLHGIAFSIDSGRITFDRPGYLLRRTATIKEEKIEPAGSLAMTRGEDGRWTGEVPVQADVHVTARFHNALGHPSRDPVPLEIIATEDQPPTVVVEKPGKDVLLPEPTPLPLLVRAFDDWGLSAVGIEVGQAENAMKDPQWVEEYSDADTSRMLLASLDPRKHNMQPGQTLLYRLVARDRKGQIARSDLYKLTIVPPPQAAAPEVAKKPPPLEGLRKALENLLKPLSKVAEALGAILPDLPDDRPMTPEEIRKLADEHAARLNDEQRKKLAEANRELDPLQKQLDRAAAQLAQAAQDAQQSPLSPALEAQSLRQLAQKAAELAQRIQPASPQDQQARPDAANIERLMQARQLTEGEDAPLPDLQRKLAALDEARGKFAEDPEAGQEQMAEVLADLQAEQAEETLEGFEEQLAARQSEVRELAEEAAAMQENLGEGEPGPPPPGKEKLIENARQAVAEADELLGRRANPSPPEGALPKALAESGEELARTREESAALRRDIGELREELSGSGSGRPLQELLGGDEAQRLLALARRAAAARESEQSGRPSEGQAQRPQPGPLKPGGASLESLPATREVIVLEGADLKADPRDRAGLYRLPPAIRDPLLQGMQEKGPEGYQPLIDAYYRQLSREVK